MSVMYWSCVLNSAMYSVAPFSNAWFGITVLLMFGQIQTPYIGSPIAYAAAAAACFVFNVSVC